MPRLRIGGRPGLRGSPTVFAHRKVADRFARRTVLLLHKAIEPLEVLRGHVERGGRAKVQVGGLLPRDTAVIPRAEDELLIRGGPLQALKRPRGFAREEVVIADDVLRGQVQLLHRAG